MEEWVARWKADPIVRQWIRDNPPPAGWAGTPTEWACLEMPVGIISKRPGFLLIVLIAATLAFAGCGDAPTVRAFDREYDWSKPAGRTAVLGIQVTYPSWLAAGDQAAVLATVESYAQGIIAKYPKAGAFWWGNLRVYLHEAVSEKIVCYYPAIWCWGWQLGQRVYTPWRPLFDGSRNVVGIHSDDVFMVVPHEVFHLIGGLGGWVLERRG